MAVAKVTLNNTVLVDMTDATAANDKILSTYTAYGADGSKIIGTASRGEVIVVDTPDSHGGTIREITAADSVVLQVAKTVEPSTSQQIITPDTGYDGLLSVVVSAISLPADFTSAWMMAPEPTDNYIHVWICLTEEMGKTVSFFAGVGEGSCDFGDGTPSESFTASGGTYSAVHTYEDYGVYEIVSTATILPPNNNIVKVSGGKNGYATRTLLRRAYIPSATAYIGQYKFQQCYGLEKITFAENALTNDNSIQGYAFGGCRMLKEIILPEGTKSLGNNAFVDTDSAVKVVLPSTLTSIGTNVFNYCYALEFHFKSTTPPTLANTNAFSNTESTSIFYVPYSADHSVLEAYKTATNWATYASRMQEEPQS